MCGPGVRGGDRKGSAIVAERVGGGPDGKPPGVIGGTTEVAQLSPAARLQILTTEQWSLLATRGMTWNEAFSRAQMFLSALSGGIVALATIPAPPEG